MKNSRKRFFSSLLTLVLCITMFIGATFAWFTDSVTSSGNIIKSGNLDIEMYWTDDLNRGTWYNVEDPEHNTVFGYDKWEPGYTEVRYIKVVNNGNLALNYDLTLTPQNGVGKLAEVINVYFADSEVEVQTREDLGKLSAIGLLNNVLDGGATASGTLLAANQSSPLHKSGETIVTMAMTMITTAGNDYQEESVGDFTITALATQAPYEQDSFGSNYDSNAEIPVILMPGKVTTTVTPDNGKVPAGGVTLSGEGISAHIPAGVVMEDGADKLTLSVTPLKKTTSDIKVVNNEVLIPVDVHIEGIAEDNTLPIVIELGEVLPKYLNMGNYHLFHVEDGATSQMTLVNDASELTAHNTFTYDPLTGEVSVAMASFSEVAMVADKAAPWNGDVDYDWYSVSKTDLTIANADQLHAFSQIVGGIAPGIERDSFEGKTVKLLSDINLNHGNVVSEDEKGKATTTIFYPIGYNNNKNFVSAKNTNRPTNVETDVESTVYSFEGDFDGDGHKISNFYQNTWEMFGDYNDGYSKNSNYYKDAMGLFGYVVNGTVKNLTVDNFESDGEFTPTGVVAAYAVNSTFENIAITYCNPRVYNTGNGGIIGIAGRDHNDKEAIVLKNITVDNSNIISALWGSWDVACGGLIGMYRGNADANGNHTGDTVSFENCHVAAQIDVYNDVCANYQYYAYRYAGMIIGSIRHNTTDNAGKVIPNMVGVSALKCTVNFGTWKDYYYCEFEKNSMASYSEDYQFSRVDKSEITFDENGKSIGCIHTHTDAEDKRAVYLPFHQLFTGYSWGVNSIGLKEYSGIVTDLDILEGDQNVSVEKFESKFTGDFLYRVGNQNAVSIGSLFAAKEDVKIVNSGVWITVEKLDENMNVSGEFTPNTTDWTKGTIQFKGTGVVKVTIQDYNFCTPTELYLEVVDATNYTSSSIGSLGSGNVTLLCDTKLNNNGSLALQNASLYGNGFKIDVSAGRTTGESITANYLLYLNNATIDNVQIIGAVYTNFDIISSNQWNNPVILSVGNSTIANSYVSNCASPVRLRSGNLNIINSTLKGGFFANLDIRGGNVVLDDVTTINQANLNDQSADGKEIVGLGIVVYYEGPTSDTTITVKNELTQFNYLKNAKTSNSYANMLIEEVFGSDKYEAVIYTDANGTKWANTGIVSLSEVVGKDNIITADQNNKNEYIGSTLTYSNSLLSGSANGYLYANNPKVIKESYEYSNNMQYEIVPKVSFDHSVNEHIKQEGSETSCTFDLNTNTETITFADGDNFEWDINILKSSNKAIDYTVWMDGKQYDDKIVFEESGTHTIICKYTDANNYRKNEKGGIVKYTAEYETSMNIVVNEMAAAAKNAEITFPLLDSYGTTKVTVDGKTYIMPNLVGISVPKYGDDLSFDASTRKYGSLKSDGKTSVDIYYPIIKTEISGNYMVFPVFGNKNGTLVQIQDYADNGTGAALTPYNASSQTLPTGLSVSRGYTVQWATDKEVVGSGSMSYGSWTNGTLAFKYQSSSDTIACKVMSNYLSYYPDINLRSNDRNEQVMVAEYKFVDSKGDTFYYCVGYHIEKRNSGYAFGDTVKESSGGCVTPDTLITLADGSKVRVDSLTGAEQLLVWNMETGALDSAPIMFVDSEVETTREVIKLHFSDGTEVKVISEHGFWDYDLNKYVYLDRNAIEYIGHTFAKQDGNKLSKVTLVDVVLESQVTTAWSPVTAGHLCYFVNGMLSMPGGVGGLFNIFDVDAETMTYDYDAMARDIETYGLFTYEELSQYAELSRDMFDAAGGQYLKVSIGKGNLTEEELIAMIERYSKYFE